MLCLVKELRDEFDTFKLQDEFDSLEKEPQDKFDMKAKDLRDKFNIKVKKIQDKFDMKVKELQAKFNITLVKLQDKFNNLVSELQDEFDTLVNKLQGKFDKECVQENLVLDLEDKADKCFCSIEMEEHDYEYVMQLDEEVMSKQQEVSSKQQEVRSILNVVKRKLQISVTTPFSIKVLCWNINGSGITDARNCLVPAVVRAESPDVLLLQEKTSETIVKLLQKFKKYEVVETTPVPPKKYFIEALILYDKDKYELHREELFPGGPILRDVIYRIIEEVVPNTTWQLKDDKTQELRNIFYNRMITVGLKIRDNPKSPIMIFISFHNIYKVDDCYVRESARLFCELVLEIQRQTGCIVVGGADLNHQLSTRYCTELGATLMQYEVTERRSEGLKVDYCIVAPASTAEEASAKALNFIDTEESDTLHSLMRNPIPKPNSVEPCGYKNDHYKEALDHDPLVCELTIYVSEDENESESENESELLCSDRSCNHKVQLN